MPLENEGKFLEWQYICTFFFFFLAVAGLRWILQDLVPWLGDPTQAPCIGIAESSSLDHQQSPCTFFWEESSYFQQILQRHFHLSKGKTIDLVGAPHFPEEEMESQSEETCLHSPHLCMIKIQNQSWTDGWMPFPLPYSFKTKTWK